jgi:hypothetical protein
MTSDENLRQFKSYSTYYLRLRCVRTTIVAVEKQLLLHIMTVFVASGIQHEMRMRRFVICGLSGS